MIKDIISKILFCNSKDVGNVLLHIPVGIVNVAIGVLSGWLALVFGIGFIIYQLSEQKIINDRAFPAIQGFLWGIGIFAIALFIKYLL